MLDAMSSRAEDAAEASELYLPTSRQLSVKALLRHTPQPLAAAVQRV
jgi:hypothetical protein